MRLSGGPGPTIRSASNVDLPAIAHILAVVDEPVGWPGVPGWPYLEHLLGHAAVAVAVDPHGAIIGFGGAFEVDGTSGSRVRWLTDLFVLPDHQDSGAGRALLEVLLADSDDRMTESTNDPRALALYARSGMRPWWPLLYVAGEVERLPAADREVSIEEGDAETTAHWARDWTGRDRSADFAYFASLPKALGFIVRQAGAVAAVGWSRREREHPGRWLEHLAIGPDADPVLVTLAAFRAAAPDGGRLGAVVPGPHAALKPLLDCGVRILDHDTFCATDPDLVEPSRILPNAGLL